MKSPYWLWEKAIPPTVCEQMIQEAKSMKLLNGIIGSKNKPIEDKSIRDNKIVFLPQNHWFEGILLNHARWANQLANWQYNINACENIQVASYKPRQKYDLHADECLLEDDKEWQRKITVVCQLSKKEDFTGGGLYIEKYSEDTSVLQNQGDLVTFPSLLLHKAAPVKTGNRLTVVAWITGPRFT